MSEQHTSSSIGFLSTLTVVFIVLKLCGTIDWSWWEVTSPLWVPWLLIFLLLAAFLICLLASMAVVAIIDKVKNRGSKS